MLHFLGLIAYFIAIIVSIVAESLTISNPSREETNLDWIYAALVLLMFLLETPHWVYKPAFTVIMLITLFRWLLETAGWYTGPVERVDSFLCLVLLIVAFSYAFHKTVIESL